MELNLICFSKSSSNTDASLKLSLTAYSTPHRMNHLLSFHYIPIVTSFLKWSLASSAAHFLAFSPLIYAPAMLFPPHARPTHIQQKHLVFPPHRLHCCFMLPWLCRYCLLHLEGFPHASLFLASFQTLSKMSGLRQGLELFDSSV